MAADRQRRDPFSNVGRRWYQKEFQAKEVSGSISYLKQNFVPKEIQEFFPSHKAKCDLAFMVSPGIVGGPLRALARKWHDRSISLGWMTVKNVRKFIDVKGAGRLLSARNKAQKVTYLDVGSRILGENVQGGVLKKDAMRDSEVSEILDGENASGHVTFALVDLETVLTKHDNGTKEISVREWAKQQKLSSPPELVLQFRAFSEEHRLGDLDAKKLSHVIKRLRSRGLEEVHDVVSWGMYCAKELGRCIGVMHRKKILHCGISLHNVLADGKPTDFDTAIIPNDYQLPSSQSLNQAINFESLVEKDDDLLDERPETFGQGVFEDLDLCEHCLDDLQEVLERCGDKNAYERLTELWRTFCASYDSETLSKGEKWSSSIYATTPT